jgi:hypothetical protein
MNTFSPKEIALQNYADAPIRVAGEYVFFDVDAGPEAKMQLHDDRTRELYRAFGITFPHNFFIKEKDYSRLKKLVNSLT